MSSSKSQIEDGPAERERKAKQRASMRWLLSKAYNNRVPDQLRDPFYTDHDGNQHLKPQIVVGLGNASIYCQVLANIYSDPNYQSLNHWSILQTLSRKGVPILEEQTTLTETVLIQTNPLRINAHMAVIEALMTLYAKEITSGERIHAAILRLTSGTPPPGLSSEQLLLLWVSHVMAALKHRLQHNAALDDSGQKPQRMPDIPAPIQDITGLCDGVCLAYLIAFYCPKLMPWQQVRISYLPTVEDSIHNVLLVMNFAQHHLPFSVFHLMPEDVTYMRGNMKQNLIALLADVFNLFEIHPAQCVDYPESEVASGGIPEGSKTNEYGIAHRRGFTCQTIQAIPDLRSGLNSPPSSAGSQGRPPFQVNRSPSASTIYRHHTPPREQYTQQQHHNNGNGNGNPDSDFVVHKSKGITTLFNMQDPLIPAKLRQAKEKTNNDSKADERGDVPAGRPSNWEEQRRPSFAGRRSRRNSFSEDSQLTIENFGGSQDQLNMIGGGTVDRRFQDRERKISSASNVTIEPTLPARSSLADARGTIQIGYDSDAEKEDRETEKPQLKRQNSNTSSSASSGVPLEDKRKMASFASLTPSTTTWQQQSLNSNQINEIRDITQPIVEDTKLGAVRLKLEEKRRHIEKEKRKIEAQMSKQLQKVGKAAFLQAINKRDKSDEDKTAEVDLVMVDSLIEKPVSLQDIPAMENQWTQKFQDHHEHNNNISLEQYQQSIALMNNDLHDIQEDIQKLAEQQNQIQVQTMQAQQLLQAQQIANILNQQYSSQQNITGMYHPIQQQQQFGSTPQLTMKQQQQQQPPPVHHQYINEQGQYMNTKIYSRENSRIIEDQYATTPSQYLNQEKQKNIAKYVQDTNHYRDQYEPQQQTQFFLHGDPQTPPQPPARRTWAQTQPKPQPEMSSWSQQAQQTWKSSPSQGGFVLHQNGRESQGEVAQRLFPVVHVTQKTPQQPQSAEDIMAPQSISFIGDDEDEADNFQTPRKSETSFRKSYNQMDDLEVSLGKLNITSGSRTYRIPSPTTRNHAGLAANSFQSMESQNEADNENEKGFYISFDNETQPKRPKPPLRTKRSPKKPVDESPVTQNNSRFDSPQNNSRFEAQETVSKKTYDIQESYKPQTPVERLNYNDDYSRSPRHQEESRERKALIIGNDEKNLDPMSVDEMERKKEKIMLLSLQRRQQQEEAKARKEIEVMQRREKDQEKDEERARKKEEQMARRAQILEQHRLKKAVEEAEREGKTLDRHTAELLMKQQQQMSTPQPKMRAVKSQRPRPKTIHVETNAMPHDISGSGKKGSASNLTGIGLSSSNSNTMRRDYYRGSQDSLSMKESPDEYPSTSSTPLGRRCSYKYGKDSDSGLGRATPPRRAPSPGMGSGSSSGRHLPSPSGPGSLPHPSLMSKRRGVVGYDDGASDISSTPSSIFGDYSGPRLYKQPATKSNRGILLNAVEYCVFPGVVNRDAKQKVLEKIARSEAKHFLVLFRDAGCQFRALYSYDPDTETIIKLYGTGPTHVYDVMFDKFFKYNSGGKCFAQVHTKHLTVTCDAFTIHNSLWQGKKATNLPSKKDMALVI